MAAIKKNSIKPEQHRTSADAVPPTIHWTEIAAMCALAILIVMTGISGITGDDDVFWHLASGRWIIDHGTIPTTDVLGHAAPSQEWIPFEWGWDVLTYCLYAATGSIVSVQLLPIVVWLAVFALLYLTIRRLKVATPLLIITLLLTLVVTLNRYTPRPHVITVLGLALVTFLYFGFRSGSGATIRSLYVLPPIFIVWGNMHLGVLNGLFLLIIIFGAELIMRLRPQPARRDRHMQTVSALEAKDLRQLGVIIVVCAAGLLVNPHGYYTYIYAYNHVNLGVLDLIKEWDPPFSKRTARTGILVAYQVMLFVGMLSILHALRKRQPLPAVLFAGFGLISLRAVRFMADFAVIGALGFANGLQYVTERSGSRIQRLLRGPLLTGILTVIMTLAVFMIPGDGFFMETLQTYRRFGFGIDSTMWSLRVMQFLEDKNIRGTPFHELEIGGLLIWDREGERNFIDSRNLNDNIAREYAGILRKRAGFEARLDRYGIDYMILHPIDLLMDSQSMDRHLISYCSTQRDVWKLVYWDDHGFIYLKNIPKFQDVIRESEYAILHPYVFFFRPDEFRRLKEANPARFRDELARKLSEEPRGIMIGQIASSNNLP